ncbi:MAG: transporter substrate-binding domain-containing protein [Bacteroidales bacterium]|jgi:membrane-bound lytic murein transglycosylase F
MTYKSVNKTIVLLLVLLFAITSCKQDKLTPAKEADLLATIKKRGKLVVTTNYNSIEYFVYKGLPMGFQLEMLKAFSNHLGVKLELLITNDLASNAGFLAIGKCDMIACNITITKERSQAVDFTLPILQTRQVLVQRDPNMTKDTIIKKTAFIRKLADLAGKKVYVQKNSVHFNQLQRIENLIQNQIHIIESDSLETEQLMELVSNGGIDYTVTDENFAKVNKTYYNNLDIKTSVSLRQNLAWAIRHQSDSFLLVINSWLRKFKTTSQYQMIYDKYYRNPRSAYMVQHEFYAIKKGKISKYDKEIKKYSKMIGWDWRLLASLIYQESNFRPEMVGWSGAFGIMQMMPETARRFGVTQKSSVAEQIKGGVKLKMVLDKLLPKEITDPEERIKFILASYNAGFEHIMDARNLAKKYGKNPNIWTNHVEYYLKMKSKPKFYNDPVVKYGYSRGYETYRFVNEVLERYKHYKNIVKK